MNDNIKKTFLKYNLVLEKLKTKFNSLYLEYVTLGVNNPIEHLKYRIKKLDSIEEKLEKKGQEFTSENIDKLNDIVGVRIVCSFLSDMEEIIEFIKTDPEIKVLKVKDYIKKPKASGYTSYHMIVQVPIVIEREVNYVNAEIQVRTIAMDMWASLEHKIWYKKGIKLSSEIMAEIENSNKLCMAMDVSLNELIQTAKHNYKPESRMSTSFMKGIDYDISMLKYETALKIVEEKVYTLYEEYEREGKINPIEHIKGRIKSSDRILSKLQKLNQECTVSNMENFVNDIAGIRIVCSFQSDLVEIIETLKNDSDFQIIKEKDYITNPKASGYMGYHLLVLVPIRLKTGVSYVKVEIQVRTIAMEMWASVEHKLCYQKEVDSSVSDELKKFSNVIRVIDENMEKTIQESRELVEKNKKVRARKKVIS